ncbi:MAG TPA: TlpA disulfide reductase family protein [Candidatus Nitrosotenuis sp.]|jgi:thiol-disulfide isomerase/thioredoxin|nr:TlpA disulfide reductase family protein [Candidatus Nitrosotenuis sp.]
MSNKIYFAGGIFVSPLILGFIWLLNNKTPEIKDVAIETPLAVQKSLTSIDFVPSPTRKEVATQSFIQLSVTDPNEKRPKKLADFAGKPIILHFWATWCSACVEEMPELDQFAQQYGDSTHIIVVASDQTQGQAAREFYQKNKIKNLSLCIDDQGKLAREFSISALPTTIFISSASKEMGKIVGPVNWTGEPGKIVSVHLTKKKQA